MFLPIVTAVMLFIVYALVSVFLYRRVAIATAASRPARITVLVFVASGLIAAYASMAAMRGSIDAAFFRPLTAVGFTWMAFVFYLAPPVAILGLASSVLRRAARRRGLDDHPARRRLLRIGTPLVLIASLLVTGYGMFEAERIRITRTTVSSAALPAEFDGLRIAVLSDIHVGPIRGADFTRRVVEMAAAEAPDVVMIVGDVIDGRIGQVGDAIEPLRDLRAPLGVFAVSGNHEVYSPDRREWLERWGSLGIEVLDNRNTTIERNGARIRVAGLSDRSTPGDDAPAPERALRGVDADDFTVLLAHQPRQVSSVAGKDVDLQLSGHTHGGQLWPTRYLVMLQQPVVDGLAEIDGTAVFTTRGAGTWGPVVRVGAPPEIPILTLRRA